MDFLHHDLVLVVRLDNGDACVLLHSWRFRFREEKKIQSLGVPLVLLYLKSSII
jgi:hypothetical protein